MTRASCFVFAALAALSFATPARADESAAAAAQLFKEGRADLQAGKLADACDRFTRSDRLDPAVGTRLSLGECNEGLGRKASAFAAYNAAASLALQRNDPRADVAKKRAEALEPKLARLTIRVATSTPDLFVQRNGVRVDPAAMNTSIPVDAGSQAIEVTAPGKRAWRTSLDVHDGEAKEVRVPALEDDASAPKEQAPAAPGNGDSQRTLALGLEIGGGVALVGGLVIGGLAISKWSSIDDTCPDGHCRTDADRDRLSPEVSTARTLATASTVVTGLGAVALVAGIVLHVTAPSPSRVAVVPVVDPRGAGVVGALRF